MVRCGLGDSGGRPRPLESAKTGGGAGMWFNLSGCYQAQTSPIGVIWYVQVFEP